MKLYRLLLAIASMPQLRAVLLAVSLSLGFALSPVNYTPAYAQSSTNRAAVLVGQQPGSRINVRSAPSTTASVQHFGLVGDAVNVLQERRGPDGYTWFLVQFPNSRVTGWVRGDFVQLSDSSGSSSLQTLPNADGVQFRALTYQRAESISAPALEAAIVRELSGNTTGIRYLYNTIDLNDDGRDEVIAYLLGSSVCGTGGCTTMIFQPTGLGVYRLVSRLTIVNNPVVVSDGKTNGWRDLVLHVAGGGAQSGYHVLRFNGSTYPSNPSTAPRVPQGTIVTGSAVIANQISPGVGIALPSRPLPTQ
jgi:hypothetical protein